jgi:sugar phosphate isomerase/epimerase
LGRARKEVRRNKELLIEDIDFRSCFGFQPRMVLRDEQNREASTMKIGCTTALFNQLDLYGALQHIAWAGFDGAEPVCLQNWARHIEPNTKEAYLCEVKSIASKHKVELFAIHANVGNLCIEDQIISLTKLFDVAHKLNIPVVTIRTEGKAGDKETTKQDFKFLRKLSDEAESRGVTLAVKPHVGASVYNIASMVQMLDEIDSPGLGVNLDTLHIYRAGEDSSEAVRKLGKKIVHVHMREYPIRPDRQNYEAEPEEEIPGRGNVDFPKILKSLKDIGYDKALDLDVIGAFTYPLSRQMGIAAEARGYLNRCLQELKNSDLFN